MWLQPLQHDIKKRWNKDNISTYMYISIYVPIYVPIYLIIYLSTYFFIMVCQFQLGMEPHGSAWRISGGGDGRLLFGRCIYPPNQEFDIGWPWTSPSFCGKNSSFNPAKWLWSLWCYSLDDRMFDDVWGCTCRTCCHPQPWKMFTTGISQRLRPAASQFDHRRALLSNAMPAGTLRMASWTLMTTVWSVFLSNQRI